MPRKNADVLLNTISMPSLIPADYANLLASLKKQTRAARPKAGLPVNRELVLLNWQTGKDVLDQQQT